MIDALILLAALCGNLLIAYVLGWLATEWRSPLLPFKPFNCRPCFSFWLCWVGLAVTYHYLTPMPWLPAICVSVSTAFALFLHLKSKINIIK